MTPTEHQDPAKWAPVTGTYRDDNDYHDRRGRNWSLTALQPAAGLPGFWTGTRHDGVRVALHRSAITFNHRN